MRHDRTSCGIFVPASPRSSASISLAFSTTPTSWPAIA
jgi:hypothetical protein